MSFAVPNNRAESGGPDLDFLGSPKTEASKFSFPLRCERRGQGDQRSMQTLALKLNRPHVLCGLNWTVRAQQNVSLPGTYTQAPQLICKTIGCNSEEPGWAWPEKTLRS